MTAARVYMIKRGQHLVAAFYRNNISTGSSPRPSSSCRSCVAETIADEPLSARDHQRLGQANRI